jgi:hypothetical protein
MLPQLSEPCSSKNCSAYITRIEFGRDFCFSELRAIFGESKGRLEQVIAMYPDSVSSSKAKSHPSPCLNENIGRMETCGTLNI